MKTLGKKTLALVLVMAMVFCLIPSTAFASSSVDIEQRMKAANEKHTAMTETYIKAGEVSKYLKAEPGT